jgi:hypothetical protein
VHVAPDAFIIVTAGNAFKPTEKLQKLSFQERQTILNGGQDRHHLPVREGLPELVDCLSALAQTPERVCRYVQTVDHGWSVGQPEVRFFDQKDFDGRMKMYDE